MVTKEGKIMANKETIDKVKSLLEGHCYGPLREAAEKWLAVADEKYDIKDKADKAWDKLNDAVDKVVESSGKFSDKMSEVSDKLSDAYDKYAGEDTELGKKIDEVTDKMSDKMGDAAEKIAAAELVKQLKEGINSVSDLLETFGNKDAAEKFGDDFAAKMKEHAEELKAKGEAFCDCDACKKARSILKDFGEDVEAKVEELKAEAEKKDEE